MAQAVRVHEEINKVMYFAWSHLPMYKTVITFRGPLAEIHMTLCRNRLLSIYTCIFITSKGMYFCTLRVQFPQVYSVQFFLFVLYQVVCRCIQFSFVDSALSAIYSYLLVIVYIVSSSHNVLWQWDSDQTYIPMTLCVQWWCFTWTHQAKDRCYQKSSDTEVNYS